MKRKTRQMLGASPQVGRCLRRRGRQGTRDAVLHAEAFLKINIFSILSEVRC